MFSSSPAFFLLAFSLLIFSNGSSNTQLQVLDEVPLQVWERSDEIVRELHSVKGRGIFSAKFHIPQKNPLPFEQALLRTIPLSSIFEGWHKDVVPSNLEHFWELRQEIVSQHVTKVIKVETQLDSNVVDDFTNRSSYSSGIIHNRNGLLVQFISVTTTGESARESDFLGRGHFESRSSYFLNYDCTLQRELLLDDVMTVDTAALLQLILRNAREQLKLSPGTRLEDIVSSAIDQRMYLSSDFCLLKDSLGFHYAHGASGGYGLTVYIPYSEIKALLKPKFKKRMDID